MTKYTVTDEQSLKYQKINHDLTRRFLSGSIDPEATNTGMQMLIENRLVSPTVVPPSVHVAHQSDPLDEYRGIAKLFVIGRNEFEQLFRPDDNPLGLREDWIPSIQVDKTLDRWIRSLIWRDDSEWQTRAILTLVPPRVGKIPTHLIGQNKLFGVPNGIIRRDVFYSDFFVQPAYDWAKRPAVRSWRVVLLYEHPAWTTNKNWAVQQRAAEEKKIKLASSVLDAWGLNLTLAVYGERLRLVTYSRTTTICGGFPLDIDSDGYGVCVDRYWSPGRAHPDVAASVHGVPLGFVS